MKVTKVTAFEDANENIYRKETEAIESNIDSCIENIGHSCSDSDGDFYQEIKHWFLNNPKDVRYILANINKIDI